MKDKFPSFQSSTAKKFNQLARAIYLIFSSMDFCCKNETRENFFLERFSYEYIAVKYKFERFRITR